MSEFTHSQILFSGDDGLPLEFNIQYAKDKAVLKPIIEHGGGICTLSDDAIYIVSPGTTVLNVNPSKNLITTSYIYECVKQNYLLDADEYRLVINELETSDISDTSQNLIGNQEELKNADEVANDSIDIIGCTQTTAHGAVVFPNSNHDFDFLDSENPNVILNNEIENIQNKSPATSLSQPVENCEKRDAIKIVKEINEPVVKSVPDSLESTHSSVSNGENHTHAVQSVAPNLNDNNNQEAMELNEPNSPVDVVIVSSSQPNEGVLDQFDNMILRKAQINPVQEEDDCHSQSYTVSSSADAQVSPPKAPAHNISAEIFDGSPSAPDSASQTTERQQYINDLEKGIEKILQKPSPKSIQDKITLVKYVCTAKQLPLAVVLQALQKI